MPEQSTQTEPIKVENTKVKEVLEILAKLLEIRSRISQDTGDFMDLSFDEEITKLYQHYKSELYDLVNKIYEYRKD